ncbi:MAG TPA: serine/threonine-protein kinase [Phycisphaerales bacterium]|nr:serine/threonine-protein kinase [Phycisphaerales bacterium]
MPDSTPLNPPPPPPPPPGRGTTVRGASSEDRGDSIGPYRLLERLGEGGFGVVWLAERREPFVQRVALKVIKPGMDSRGVIARFDQERQALAVMDHPNVARVLDGGLTSAEQGSRPYFVMEYVKGEPITEYCDRNRLNIRQRLELFIPVCEAVQHAHHKGIIHRDIKPTNVLVTVLEGRLAPKVIDFGVAKAVSHTLTQHTILTEHGQLIGTPEYMSPEQAEMGGTDVDTRTDVYSLGVLLYELLTGQLPFEPATLRAAAFDEVRRIIREEEPPKPSTRLTTLDAPKAADVASRRQQEREELTSTLRRELDWIPLRAMRKDRSRRYASPSALAEDIQRYLDGEVIDAAPESRAYLVRKFVKRHRLPVVAGCAVVAALVLGVVVSAGFAAKAMREQRKAEDARAAADTARGLADAASKEALAQARLAEERLSEVQREKAAAQRVAEAVDLLGKAEQELTTGSSEYPSYYKLLELLKEGYTTGSPNADIAIRRAFAASAASSDNGDYEDARVVLEGAVVTARGAFGDGDATTLQLLGEYATACFDAEEYPIAVDAYRNWISALQDAAPGDSPEVVRAMCSLAEAQRLTTDEQWQQTIADAELMAMRMWPNDEGSLDVAISQHVDRVLMTSRPQDAVPINSQRMQWLLKSPTADTIRTLDQIASAYLRMSESRLAESVYQEQVRLAGLLLADPRPQVMQSRLNLAAGQMRIGQDVEAEASFRAAVQIGKDLWPQETALFNTALNAYREFLEGRKRTDDRYAFFLDWGRFLADHGEKDIDTAVSWLESDASTLAAESRDADATTVRRWIVELCERSLPSGDRRRAIAHLALGRSLMEQRAFAESAVALGVAHAGLQASDAASEYGDKALRDACVELNRLHQRWETAEPGAGHAESAAHWERATADFDKLQAHRDAALQADREKHAEATRLNNQVWPQIATREAAAMTGAEKIAEAVRTMEHAAELYPHAWTTCINTLGVAQYRAGLFEASIQTLTKADSGEVASGRRSQAANWAFIALAQKRLGLTEEAGRSFYRYKEALKKGGQQGTGAELASWEKEMIDEFGR